MVSRRHPRWHRSSLARRPFPPSDPPTSMLLHPGCPYRDAKSAASIPTRFFSSFYLLLSAFYLLFLSPLECAVEHPIKDASPACPEPRRREGVSRPKDLNIHVSLLECAVTQNAPLSALECAVTKIRSGKSFRMRSSEKRWGVPLSRCCAEVGGFEVQDAGQVKEEKRAARSMRFEARPPLDLSETEPLFVRGAGVRDARHEVAPTVG